MEKSVRKQSPRAPSMPLQEAIERAITVYEREQRHAAPTEVIAQDLGYKSANNGAALSAIASLRGYGLLERPEVGKLAVAADVQSFHYAPDESLKRRLLRKWLETPPVFAQLLEKYQGGLPSDPTIRFDLIQQGFNPATAESILRAFKESVQFARYYENHEYRREIVADAESDREHLVGSAIGNRVPESSSYASSAEADRIPVRLDAKRRAWLEIPTPFYEADKHRLKAQIDLLITDDVGNGAAPDSA